MKEKIEALIQQMTLEEKASLCSGGSDWSTQAVKRLGVPEVLMTDGPHGVRWMDPKKLSGAFGEYGLTIVTELDPEKGFVELLHRATCFPPSATTASSWDRDLLEEIGKALGRECQHYGVSILLAPGINIKRHPLTGRNYEYFSEDPCLAGELASAYVKGVQSEGVGTSVKHFACNNAEHERLSMSSDVGERALREIYLSAFERVVKHAKPWTVMSSYNRINSVDASHNAYLLTDILKKDWGFEGVVVSDWWAVRDRVKAAKAGLDLEMPGNPSADVKLLQAVESGELDEGIVDEMCRRILTLVFKSIESRKEDFQADFEEHDGLARKAAAESVVLLKNDSHLLPLDAGSGNKIAVLGRMARVPRYQGVGSSLVNPTKLSNALDAIREAAGGASSVPFAEGYPRSGEIDEALLREAVDTAKNSDVAVVFAGLPIEFEMESWDRPHMDMPEGHVMLIQEVAKVQKNTVVVLNSGSCVTMLPWIEDVPAVLEAWLGGQAGGPAIADVLFGAVTPSGKLAVTVPRRLEDTPAYLHFAGENGKHLYGEGIFVGYRYYDTRRIDPLFPFGYGLSYTSFEYSDLKIDRGTFSDKEGVTVACKVTNTGSRRGKEIVQLYVADHEPRLRRPEKELRAFQKIELNPGETKTVSFTLADRDFSYYDPALGRWVAESGTFDILIGKSSREICLRETVELRSTQNNFIPLTRESYTKDFLDNGLAREMFREFLIQNGLMKPDISEEAMEGLRTMFVPIGKAMEVFASGAVSDKMLDDLLEQINKRAAG